MFRHLIALLSVALVLAGLWLVPSVLKAHDPDGQHVLVINSYHPGLPWSKGLMRGLGSVLDDSDPALVLHVEYLDGIRHRQDEIFPVMKEYLGRKYEQVPLNVILTTDDVALDFLFLYREELFPGVPVVFCSPNDFTAQRLDNHDLITGIAQNPNMRGTIDLIRDLHPDAQTIAVVADRNPASLRVIQGLMEIEQEMDQPGLFTMLTDAGLEELLAELQTLPVGTPVVFHAFLRDAAGRTYPSNLKNLRYLSGQSGLPFYTFKRIDIGHGAVGGAVISEELMAEIAAGMAVQVLQGVPAEAIPPVYDTPQVYLFDYEQLQRFGIKPDRLPAASVIINRPFSLFHTHKGAFYVAGAALILLLSLLGVLVTKYWREKHKRKKVAQDLLQSEQQFRSLFMESPISIIIHDKDSGDIIDANPAAYVSHGMSSVEEMREGIFTLAPPYSRDEAMVWIRKAATEGIQHFEWKHRTTTGDIFWEQVQLNVVRLDGVDRVLASTVDITERKQSEEQLRKLSRAVEQSPVSIVLTDVQGTIEYVNPAFTKVTGYAFDEVRGQNLWALNSPDRTSEDCKEMWATLAAGKEWRGEFTSVRKNGDVYWESASISPIINEQGRTTHYVAVKEDITKRKQTEARLLELNMAVEQSGDGIAMADLDGNIRFVNKAWAALHGYTLEEVMGQHLHIFHTPEQLAEEVEPFNKRLFETGTNIGEVGHVRKDGSPFPAYMSVTVAKDASGTPFGLLAAVRDITEQKKVEEALRIAKKQAEASARAKSEFLANMSHEIRTPMNGVIGMTGLLLDTDMTDEQRCFAQTIQSSGESLLALINDILDFSKIEAGRLDIEILDFDLHDLLDDLSTALALRAHDKGLEYISHISPDVPHLLQGDPGRLRQILTNLVGNAIKFTEQGEVVVMVEAEVVHGSRFSGSAVGETADDGTGVGAKNLSPDGVTPIATYSHATPAPTVNREPLNPEPHDREPLNREPHDPEPLNPEPRTVKLRFTVRDTGIGIPEDKLGLLFDKFSQVDAGITRKFGGTGLGLAISRQLAGLMGGEVGVRSTPGQGSAFWFTARFGLQESPPNLTFTHPRELSGLHVLVVDDNATNLEILVKQFTAWGMRPQGVDSGQAALDAAAKAHDLSDPFDLAVVDFQMPGMDGGELGKRLKADPRFQAMPLIMLTSLGRPGDARMCADLGFSAYLNKPVRQSELHDTLALALADTDQRTPAQPIITRHMARENQRRQLAYPRFSGRILLAEDNPVNQQVALGILKKMGLRADAVGNGLEALHALLTLPYDLVFMDVQMPDMDGLEATKRIRIQESGVWSQESDDRGWSSCPQVSGLSPHPSRRLPVIALTAGAMTEDRETCLEAGMDDYVSKPVSPMELARVLEKWLPVVQDGGQKAEVRGQGSEVRDQESEIRGQKPENEEQEEENVSSEEIRSVEQPIAGEEQAGGEKALPVFDRAALLERFMGDENLLAQVMGLTLENVPVRIQEIRAALEKNDASGVRLAAHTIKGMAANTSAGALREVAGEMEQAAQAGDLDAVRDRMGVLEERFEALREMAGG